MDSVHYYGSPVGGIGVASDGDSITRLFFTEQSEPDYTESETPVVLEAIRQLREYFDGERRDFDLPLELSGTDFQLSVWNALRGIPYGQTRSYAEIAREVGHPKSFRAVGMANNRNPIAIIIPCHRVIGSDGSLTGFGGGIETKSWLLELERG
ncbi:MAG: methylated-DNA--[protein]-cysteine S-methyltransferase [Clostridiales Family XIII bacterium]|jgi:methylated-DNA-[protein]-cysteine S-methyltransferase|nr:methylated-DNA--[protein]-cysteine S-methyltransferase [Clostridiales Family XIII bacterium]